MDLKFNDGLIFKERIQVFILPKYYYLKLLETLAKNYKNIYLYNLLVDYFVYDAYSFYKNLPNNIFYNKKNSIDFFLIHLNSLGFGKIKIIYFNESKIIFKRLFTKNKNLENSMLASFLNSYLNILFGYSYFFSEEHKFNLIFEKTDKKYIINGYKNISPKKITQIRVNSLIKKFFINSFVYNIKGEMKIWSIPIIVVPSIFFIHLISNEKLNKNEIVFIARSQARCAVEFQKKFFGLLNKSFLFKEIIKQSELMGFGFVDYDFNLNEFEIKNNFSKLKNENSILNENIELYLSNLILGSYQQIFSKQSKLIKLNGKRFKIIKTQTKLSETNIPYQKINEVLNS